MAKYRVGIVGCTGIAARRREDGLNLPLGEEMPGSHAAAHAIEPSTQVVAVCDILQRQEIRG